MEYTTTVTTKAHNRPSSTPDLDKKIYKDIVGDSSPTFTINRLLKRDRCPDNPADVSLDLKFGHGEVLYAPHLRNTWQTEGTLNNEAHPLSYDATSKIRGISMTNATTEDFIANIESYLDSENYTGIFRPVTLSHYDGCRLDAIKASTKIALKILPTPHKHFLPKIVNWATRLQDYRAYRSWGSRHGKLTVESLSSADTEMLAYKDGEWDLDSILIPSKGASIFNTPSAKRHIVIAGANASMLVFPDATLRPDIKDCAKFPLRELSVKEDHSISPCGIVHPSITAEEFLAHCKQGILSSINSTRNLYRPRLKSVDNIQGRGLLFRRSSNEGLGKNAGLRSISPIAKYLEPNVVGKGSTDIGSHIVVD